MKKLVTVMAMLLMTVAFSSYSNAQCIGCSQGVAPSFAQPINTVQSYGTPVYNSAPIYDSAPVYNSVPAYDSAPVFDSAQVYNSAPVYDSAPVYNSMPVYDGVVSVGSSPAPISYGEPVYGSPIASAPMESYSAPDPIYAEAMMNSYPMASPVANYPMATGSCCGGAVSGGMVGQPIYDSYPASQVISGAWPVSGGQVIAGGTVIGETVVSTPSADGDSVSPPTPVAEEQVSPVPDESGDSKKEGKEEGPKEDDGT